MADENRDDGTRDRFKLFLEEALAQQMNEMMDNFTPDPLMDADNNRGTLNQQSLQRCNALQGTS
jgi:hypothetical protein